MPVYCVCSFCHFNFFLSAVEHCQNRAMFRQFLQSGAIDICQVDSCRMGGVNEVLVVMLIAAKLNIPVCRHAGGVSLCEYVQHLSMIDYICISGSLENRITEYVDHLHEHFIDPVVIKDGNYMPPKLPGYSIEMKKNPARLILSQRVRNGKQYNFHFRNSAEISGKNFH